MNKLINEEFIHTKDKDGNELPKKRWRITYECALCNTEFTMWKKPHLLLEPCTSCKTREKRYNKFLAKAIEKHGDKFNYQGVTAVNYKTADTKVSILCNKHNLTFLQTPSNHISTENGKLCCPMCIKEFAKTKNKRTLQSWKDELAIKLPHITMTSNGASDTNTEKADFTCQYHGDFKSRLCTIKTSKQFCPMCVTDANSWGGRTLRTDIPGTVYFVYIPSISHWKLGVTSVTLEERFRWAGVKYDVVWTQEYATLKEAYVQEAMLFRKYKQFRRAKTKPNLLPKGGYTELLTCEIPFTGIHTSNSMSKES